MASKLEELGLKDYLNSTKGLHNNKGFKDFVKLYEEDDEPRSAIAEKFGVTRPTIYEWIKLYDKMRAEEKK